MVVQRAFNYGEISPSLQKRVDLDSYARSAKTMRNWKLKREGGVETRPGTILSAPVKYSTSDSKNVIVREFVFNSDLENVYAIEIGDEYMRFHKNREQIRLPAQNITAITKASVGVVTYSGADPANGTEVYISGIYGMTEMNGRWCIVANVDTGANTFELKDKAGVNIDTSAYTTYSSGGTIEPVYEITTTYDEADLYALSFAQLNDVINIAGGIEGYAPAKLTRTSDTSWALTTISFDTAELLSNYFTYAGGGSGGSTQLSYKVRAADEAGREYASVPFLWAISGATKANPCQLTINSHVLADGDLITVTDVVGMTELNGNTYTVTVTGANTITIGVNSSGYTTYSSNGYARTDFARSPATANPASASNHVTLTIYAIAGVSRFIIYKQTNGIYSFLGSAAATTGLAVSANFIDLGQDPDTSDTVAVYPDIFGTGDDYPYCVAYGQQRLIWAGSDNNPNRIWPSRKGDYYNMSYHQPAVADDAMTLDLVGDRAQIVRSIKEINGRVIVFCSEGEFGIGDDTGTIDATAPAAQQFSSNGSTTVRPLLINNIATFIQARSSQVRDLGFSFQDNNYKGEERSIRSSHLFKGHTITDWCYQQVPDSIIWAVRDDGMLLGCTYVREEQMAGWHRHDMMSGKLTDRRLSKILSICSVPGDGQDDVYMVVKRYDPTYGLTATVTVEVFDTRTIGTLDDNDPDNIDTDQVVERAFMDSAISYDGRHTSGIEVRLQGGTTWAAGESMTLHSSSTLFASRGAENVGNSVFLHFTTRWNTFDLEVRCLITAYTDGSNVTVTPDVDIPALARSEYAVLWDYAQPYIDGLWTLEGQQIAVMGDGFVEASPYNQEYTVLTVASGRVELSQPYAVIRAGMPFLCDLELLDIDASQVQGGGLMHRAKIVNKLYVAVEDTRGLFIGKEAPSDDDDDATENLEPVQRRENDLSYGAPVPLETTVKEQDAVATWDSQGSAFIRQVDPLPATILAVYPDGVTYI